MQAKPSLLLGLALLMLFVASPNIVVPVRAACAAGPDFLMEASPDSLTMAAGISGTSEIIVTSLGGFADTVSLDVFPDVGISATVSPDNITLASGGSANSTLSVSVDSVTPPGFYGVLVEGTSGPLSDYVTVIVTVIGPEFTMTADTDSLTVEVGGMNMSTITVLSINGFEGTVDLNATVFPFPAFVALLSPNPIDLVADGTETSVLTVETTPLTPPGTYFVFVTGVSGIDFSSVTIMVVVKGPGFSIEADTFFLLVEAGSSNSSVIAVTSTGGFSDKVDLSADTPLNVTASFAAPSITPPPNGTVTSVMTVSVDSLATPGFYLMHVIGTSSLITNSIIMVVEVPFPGFSMEASPVTLTIGPGFSAASNITLTSLSGFSGKVGLTPTPDDPCLEASVLPDSVALSAGGTNSSILVVDVDPVTPPGFDSVRVEGTTGFAFDFVFISVLVSGPGNDAPVLGPIGDVTVGEEFLLNFTATAVDPDGDSLTFSLAPGAPSGAAISTGGAFTWTPTESQGPVSYPVTVVVSDGSLEDSETIMITVLELNKPPLLASISDKSVQADTPLSFSASGTDSDLPSQPLTFSIGSVIGEPFPTGAAMSPSGIFSWTPSTSQVGIYRARVTVSDGVSTDSEEITITVTEGPVNNPPELVPIGNKQVDEGTQLTFTVTATDPDSGQTVTLAATELCHPFCGNLPAGATLIGGVFAWTPTEAQGPKSYTVQFRATDDGSPAMSDSEIIVITVSEVNQGPLLNALQSRTVEEGATLTFTATASDPDAPVNTLTYSLGAGAPVGASISPIGVFSWTPSADQGPGAYTISVILSDGSASDSKSFTVTVTEAQRTPSAPAPFWEQYWYLLVIVAALGGIVVLWKVLGRRRGEVTP